jgi:O-antigen/teichoic acid export membrane protein
VGLVALFTAYIFGDDILELLYGAKWEGGPATALAVRSHHIFIYLMGAFVAMSSIHVFGTFITAEGRMKWLTFLALAAMGLNMGINFWLIPIYGAMGAAVSALITQWFFAGACAVRVWQSETIKTQNLKWKVIPMSAFHGLLLAVGVYRANGLPQREILEAVVWLLFVIGVVWMLFGLDIADFWKNRKTQTDKVL